jgi:hypothetical protein
MAESAHDSFFARALVLDDGRTALVMVVVDSLSASPEVLDEAKRIASKKTGLRTDRMLICSTHTHSGPPSNTKAGPAPAVAYRKVLVDGLAVNVGVKVRRVAERKCGTVIRLKPADVALPPLDVSSRFQPSVSHQHAVGATLAHGHKQSA